MSMSRAEEKFKFGLPSLLNLPLEVRQRLVDIAKSKSPSAAIQAAQQDIGIVGLPTLKRLEIGKTIRWLAMIRQENEQVFKQKVQLVTPAATENPGKEE